MTPRQFLHQLMAGTLDAGRGGDSPDPEQSPRAGSPSPPAVARCDRAFYAVPRGGPVQRRWTAYKLREHSRAHQVAAGQCAGQQPEHLSKMLESWMKSYRPEELFDGDGKLIPEIGGTGSRRGRATHGLQPPRQRRQIAPRFAHAGNSRRICGVGVYPRRVLSKPRIPASWVRFLRDVIKLSQAPRNFRLFRAGRNQFQPFDGRF